MRQVIFLNGTSSAGKTTLARAIQDESEVPHVYWGIDTLFSLVPANWGGGRDGPLSRAGFWYDRTGRDVDGRPIVVIRYGEAGLARGHHRTVHAHGIPYDLTIDTTTGTPAELARAVLTEARKRPGPAVV